MVSNPDRRQAKDRKPLAERFMERVDVRGSEDCWHWTGYLTGAGYGQIRHLGKKMGAHRIAWEIKNGPIPAGMFICHRCDNPKCVNPSHLFVGSSLDNMRDKMQKGRGNALERHPMAKLNRQKAAEIRRLASEGVRYVEIARRFQIHPDTATRAAKGKRWL